MMNKRNMDNSEIPLNNNYQQQQQHQGSFGNMNRSVGPPFMNLPSAASPGFPGPANHYNSAGFPPEMSISDLRRYSISVAPGNTVGGGTASLPSMEQQQQQNNMSGFSSQQYPQLQNPHHQQHNNMMPSNHFMNFRPDSSSGQGGGGPGMTHSMTPAGNFSVPEMSPTMMQRMHNMVGAASSGGSGGGMFMPGSSVMMSSHPNVGGGPQQQQAPMSDSRGGAQGGPVGGMASMSTGGGGGPLPADPEEELLVNLLIARRQRAGQQMASGGPSTSGSTAPNPQTLADELLRLRQSRAASMGAGGGNLGSGTHLSPFYGDALHQQQQHQQQQQFLASGGNVSHFGAAANPAGTNFGVFEYHQQRMNSNMAPPDPGNLNLSVTQEMNERIDHTPGRFMDARSQDMLDFSGRSSAGLRGRGGFAADMNMGSNIVIKYPATGGGMDTGNNANLYGSGFQDAALEPVKKKKRTHKKKPADMPRRPLSAYNLFFSEERVRILSGIEGKDEETEIKDEGEAIARAEEDEDVKQPEEEEEGGGEKSTPEALLQPLIPSEKKRRPHRKTHGKISFQQLARMVGERWKNLPDDRRKKYQDMAQDDMKRQKVAMEEYYAKQNTAKLQAIDTSTEKAEESGGATEKRKYDELEGV